MDRLNDSPNGIKKDEGNEEVKKESIVIMVMVLIVHVGISHIQIFYKNDFEFFFFFVWFCLFLGDVRTSHTPSRQPNLQTRNVGLKFYISESLRQCRNC